MTYLDRRAFLKALACSVVAAGAPLPVGLSRERIYTITPSPDAPIFKMASLSQMVHPWPNDPLTPVQMKRMVQIFVPSSPSAPEAPSDMRTCHER